MTDDKRAALTTFLAAFQKATTVLDVISRGRRSGHPKFQEALLPLADSLDVATLESAEETLCADVAAWTEHLEESCRRQRRLRLFTAAQVGANSRVLRRNESENKNEIISVS